MCFFSFFGFLIRMAQRQPMVAQMVQNPVFKFREILYSVSFFDSAIFLYSKKLLYSVKFLYSETSLCSETFLYSVKFLYSETFLCSETFLYSVKSLYVRNFFKK